MSDVFLSYKREDAERVRALVDALVAAKLTVWWDRELRGGQEWRGEIARELEGADCVIVVWSKASVGEGATFVWDEANRARLRGVLLPVRIDSVAPPVGFGECQTLDLVGWRGNPQDARVRDVIATAQAIINSQARPRLEWPRVKRWRLGLSGSATLALLCLALVPLLQRRICDFSVMQRPCLWIGIERTCVRTQENVRQVVYTARANEIGAPSEAEAKTSTLAAAEREVFGGWCADPNHEKLKLKTAKVQSERWNCRQVADKYYCSFDGKAICTYDEQRVLSGAASLEER